MARHALTDLSVLSSHNIDKYFIKGSQLLYVFHGIKTVKEKLRFNMTATQKHHFSWIRLNSRQRTYQLRAGRKKVISLTWQNIRGTCATAEARGERWYYTCVGYLSKQVVVQSAETGRVVAIFKPGAGGGVLRFMDGGAYTLKSAHPLHPEMLWTNEQGEAVLRFKGDFHFKAKSGGVDLVDHLAFDSIHESALLISLGWYLMVSSHLDMALIL